jgi:hypothetical protein
VPSHVSQRMLTSRLKATYAAVCRMMLLLKSVELMLSSFPASFLIHRGAIVSLSRESAEHFQSRWWSESRCPPVHLEQSGLVS